MIQKLILLQDHNRNFEEKHQKVILRMLTARGASPEMVRNISLSELHVIDCIGSHEEPNVTFIAEQTGMTKGAVSKIASRMVDRKFIEARKRDNNRKEILYSLTKKGKVAFDIHKKFHDTENKKLHEIFASFKPEELKIIDRFFNDILSDF